MVLLEQADRRFNALQIITKEAEDSDLREGVLDGTLVVSAPRYKNPPAGGKANGTSQNHNGSGSDHMEFEPRFCVLDRHVLNLYIPNACCGNSGEATKLDRALSLEHANIHGQDETMTIRVERPEYEILLRCSTVEDMNLWKRRLEEEAYTSVLFHSKDAKLRADLTPAQLDRYDLFQNERQFVQDLTDLAEELRFKDRAERKKLAPILMEKLNIPETVYLPLCNSSDIWRRAAGTVPNDTRVFNTKERCPVIMYFVSKRGEMSKRGSLRVEPNLDVAEFLHNYFDVTPDTMDQVVEGTPEQEHELEKNGKANAPNKGPDDAMRASEHDSSYSGVWANEDTHNENDESGNEDNGVDFQPPTPTSEPKPKGNLKVQRLLRESFVTLPHKLSKRLGRGKGPRSVMDRQTQMQPMVQIIEGRADDADNASIGDGTVVSVERSSILVKDRILYGDLDEGDINLESIDRAKKFVSHGESWAEKSAKMLENAKEQYGEEGVQLEITSCMSKSNDDLRQEVFVMQMIHFYKSVFAQAKLPLWLKTYRILSTGSSTGLLEVLVDATSLDGLKKSEGYPKEGGLRKYFEIVYGGPDSNAFKAAQSNFMQSLAAYALVSYLLGLKDRHNGNIMIDTRGHLIFIDFGFALGMAPGHEFSMERAPFKLTKEMVEVMGGVRSECYKEFERIFVAGFEEARKNSQIALGLVEIMMFQSNYPCFSGWRYGKGKALVKFEKRLMLRISEKRVRRKALGLIRNSRRHFGTYLYDVFQKATNGYEI
jgi:phosphatidylinositol 4-kinase A